MTERPVIRMHEAVDHCALLCAEAPAGTGLLYHTVLRTLTEFPETVHSFSL